METIDDIVREMREYEQRIRNATDGCDPDVADNIATGVRDIANRIEEAAKSTVMTDNTEVLHNLLDANARLIAAAPELYECLRDAVNNECRPCEANVYGVCKDIDSSDDDVLCFVKRWRKALAKAGGEEAAK